MTIFEVRFTGGEWEDRFDDHICAFMSKEAAEKKCEELNRQEQLDQEQIRLCAKCPLAYRSWGSKEAFEACKKEYEYYAPCVKDANARLEEYMRGENFYNDCWQYPRDKGKYYIFEMEVEE